MKQYVIGIDFGTLSGRAVLADPATGEILESSVYHYKNGVIDRFLPGASTPLEADTALQDPDDYLDVLKFTVPWLLEKTGISPAQIAGVGVDFTASSPLPCHADGTPLCKDPQWRHNPHAWVKLWKHHSAQPEADEINRLGRQRGEFFIENYGGKYSSEWFFSKLLQVLHDAPDLYRACDRWIEAGDWIVWKLTGHEVRSQCFAGYKGMWVNAYGDGWAFPHPDFFLGLSPGLVDLYDRKLSMKLHPLGTVAGHLCHEAAHLTGLREGTPVAVGVIDAHAAVPACGVGGPGKMVMIMGTSTCNMLLTDSYRPVEGICGAVHNGILPGCWGYEAGQSAAGDMLGWFVENGVPESFAQKARAQGLDLHSALTRDASALRPGQSGLLALDWWNGNRSTLVDAGLTGCLFGLKLSTSPPEIYRALVEATAFGQHRIFDAFESSGIPINEVYACGGLTQNRWLMQAYADILGRPIFTAATEHATALGSAIHAAVACGLHRDFPAAIDAMSSLNPDPFIPDFHRHARYAEIYREYSVLYDLLGRHQLPTLGQLRRLSE
ncbi:MAG: ribulokinase [Verrucomicrobiae bacterium]|nr:ribulokinase [Verrucomicrobiae bacterium]